MIIHKCIVHVLDKTSEVPVLNEYELKISAEVDRFFQKVIKKVMKDDDLRKARFKNFNKNIVCNCSEQMVYDESSFLENSKEIAAYLFEVMSVNPDLETCDLAVCVFTQKDEHYVAILKLDYKKLYTHAIEFIDDKFLVNFVANNMCISETINPKHCAIVSGSMGVNDEYHLRIIDEQTKKEDSPSKFVTEFLDAEVITDDKQRTKVFKNAAETWITNALCTDIKQAEDIRSILNYTLKEKEELDIDEFVEKSIQDKDLKVSFKEHMENKGLEEGFIIDKKWVEKNLKKRYLKTDTGFNIKSDLCNFEDPMKYSVKHNSDGSIDITIKNIKLYEVK